jgi:phosphoglycolate phosphatase
VAEDLRGRNPELAEMFHASAHGVVIEEEVAAARNASPFPGVIELLGALREADKRIGIVTRNCRPAVEAILANHPIPHDVLLTRDDVSKVKPDPDHLLQAARRIGLSLERALMVGDHPMDVVAGKAAGARTVGILNVGRPADYFAEVEPTAVLSSVTEIPAHFLRNRS